MSREPSISRSRLFQYVTVVALFAATISSSRHALAQRDINHALLDAADRGDIATVDDLLKKGADPNTFDRENFATPLRRAVYQGHLKIVEELLDWGADPRVGGTVAIDETVYKKREDIARLLMSRGVDINEKDSNGTPTLERQLWGIPEHPMSQVADVSFLLKLGADPNAQSPGGVTTLMMIAGRSAMNDRTEEADAIVAILQMLIKSGARLEAQDDKGATALIHAMDGGTMAAIRVLTEAGANINHQNKQGVSSLLIALQRRDRDGRIDYLLAHGADVKVKDNDGQTTVIAAMLQGYVKYLSLFIKRGVDPNARTQSGRTAAHWAASYYNINSQYDSLTDDKKDRAMAIDMLRMLAQAGADLGAADNEGMTPLHMAARAGYTETLRFLLDRRGDLNKRDAKGETPVFLSVAAFLDAFPKLQFLVSKKANVDIPNIEGTTPLMLAAMTRNRGMLMYLLGQKADANAIDKAGLTALNVASAIIGEQSVDPRDYAAVIAALASEMSSVDQRDRMGMTPLMWTAISNIPDALKPLLKKGADVNARSADGRTPLMWAACANADQTIPELLSNAADRMAKDKQGRTALDWARVLDQPVGKLLESQSKTP